jgi:hypothetical protein
MPASDAVDINPLIHVADLNFIRHSVPASNIIQPTIITKTKWLMMFKKIMPVYSETVVSYDRKT